MSIYGLSYHKLAQTSYFQSPLQLSHNGMAVVEMDQGQTLARVVSGPHADLDNLDEGALPHVIRIAEADDIARERVNNILSDKAKSFWLQCVRHRHLDMKLVDVEIFLDRSKFIFYFTAPARIDFRELVKDLVHEYRVRIELRQIGVRHETQMVGAVGNCGMVCCCRRYLHQFAPVTIRMAKEQNLFLNPAKVSGICGRLLCCLAYEQDSYDAFHRECPKLAKKYQTNKGTLKVIRANMFCDNVTCLTDSNEELKFTLAEWKGLEPHRPDPLVPATSETSEVKPVGGQSQQGGGVHDELVVVQAAPDNVGDPDFFNEFFPEYTEPTEEKDGLSKSPTLQPGDNELHQHKKRRRKLERNIEGGRPPLRSQVGRAAIHQREPTEDVGEKRLRTFSPGLDGQQKDHKGKGTFTRQAANQTEKKAKEMTNSSSNLDILPPPTKVISSSIVGGGKGS